jgi:hypothetical protein
MFTNGVSTSEIKSIVNDWGRNNNAMNFVLKYIVELRKQNTMCIIAIRKWKKEKGLSNRELSGIKQ